MDIGQAALPHKNIQETREYMFHTGKDTKKDINSFTLEFGIVITNIGVTDLFIQAPLCLVFQKVLQGERRL